MLCVRVFSSRRTQNNLISPLSDQAYPLVWHIGLGFFYFKFHWKLKAFKGEKFSMLEFEAFDLSTLSLI